MLLLHDPKHRMSDIWLVIAEKGNAGTPHRRYSWLQQNVSGAQMFIFDDLNCIWE